METNNSFENTTFDEFLVSIGDIWLIDIIYLFILPLIGITGSILNAFSIWIFFLKDFTRKNFFLCQVLSVVNFICTFLTIAYGICFSPRYLPFSDTYIMTLVQLIYIPISE